MWFLKECFFWQRTGFDLIRLSKNKAECKELVSKLKSSKSHDGSSMKLTYDNDDDSSYWRLEGIDRSVYS